MNGSFNTGRWIATAAVALMAGLAALPAMAHNQSAVYTGRSSILLVDRPPIAVGISIPGVISGNVIIPGSRRDDYYRDRDDYYRDRDDYRPLPYVYRRDNDSRWDRDHHDRDDYDRNNDYRDNHNWDNSRRDGGNYRPYDRH